MSSNDAVSRLIERVGELNKAATDGPWAWEQYGEKENCFHVGTAVDKNDKPLSGRVESETYDEDTNIFIEDVLWRDNLGSREGATVNYSDPQFICLARTLLPRLAEMVEMSRRNAACSNTCPNCISTTTGLNKKADALLAELERESE